jgi:hypothetical protein
MNRPGARENSVVLPGRCVHQLFSVLGVPCQLIELLEVTLDEPTLGTVSKQAEPETLVGLVDRLPRLAYMRERPAGYCLRDPTLVGRRR